MFIQSVIRTIPASPTGIQLAHPSFDKKLIDAAEEIYCLALAIVLLLQFPRQQQQQRKKEHKVITFLLFASISTIAIFNLAIVLSWCQCYQIRFTVSALYAETLATIWTTAASLHQRPSAQLAAVCLFLATLTIAARCYASSNATHPLVQFNSHPSSFSPIDNSNNNNNNAHHVPHSSNLVLSRLLLLKSPHQSVQSDTSIIVINSKKLLHNQNSNTAIKQINTSRISSSSRILRRRPSFRTKREIKSSQFTNNIQHQQIDINNNSGHIKTSFGDSNNNNTTVLVNTTTITATSSGSGLVSGAKNTSVGDSERVNYYQTTTAASSSSKTLSTSIQHQNDDDSSYIDSAHSEETDRPMPPVHDHSNASLSDLGILVLILSAIVLTVALGLITCVLSHYRPVAGEGAADGGTAADPHDAARTPTTAPMLSVVSAGAAAGVGGMDRLRGGRAARELAATRDRQVRLHAVHTDLAINLPPSIAMPDGEEHPFASSRLHLRDPEQESEIHQKCIRPPPNRTVLESESPPPYRSSSAGLLGSSSSCSTSSSGGGGGDWSSGGNAPLVVRCHSMSSTSSSSKRPEAGSSGQKTDFLQRTVKIFTGGSKKGTSTTGGHNNSGSGGVSGGGVPPIHQTLPVVIVPTRLRRTSSDQQNSAASSRSKPSV